MKLVKGGLVAAVLSLLAMAFTASSAFATNPPIRGAFSATGSIALDGNLGGTSCSVDASGTDLTISSIDFYDCSGVAGEPTALPSWTIRWNSDLVSGTITVAALSVVLGSSCLYAGAVPFRYSAGTLTLATVTRLPKISGGIICPSSVSVNGTLTV
jgi:hypothetical protein